MRGHAARKPGQGRGTFTLSLSDFCTKTTCITRDHQLAPESANKEVDFTAHECVSTAIRVCEQRASTSLLIGTPSVYNANVMRVMRDGHD